MYIKELTDSEFNTFSNKFNNSSIYQTSEYGIIMSGQGYEYIFLGLIDDDEIIGASLILIEKLNMFKYAYAPKGFLIDYDDEYIVETFTREIKNYLGKNKIIAIKINPMIIKSSYDYKTNETITNPDFDRQLKFLRKLGYYHLGFNNLFESFKPRYEAILNIDKPINDLFNTLDKGFKNKIMNADKNGIRIIKANENELDYLYEQIKHKYPRDKKYFEDCLTYYKDRNLIDYYYAKIDTKAYLINVQKKYQTQNEICAEINNELFNNVGKDNEKIINRKINEENKLNEIKNELINATNFLKEKPDGIVVASMLITKYKDEVYLYMDGYDKNYKKVNAKHLMIWKLIEKYSTEGYKKFNLGGMTNPNLDNERYNGLNEFKLSFNAKCIEYIGDLELITNWPLYSLYRNSKPIRYILNKK